MPDGMPRDIFPSSSRPPGTAIRMVLVGGVGRSGSTLLDRLLGQLPGHVSVGELAARLWERSLLQDWPCGCGKRFSDCEFWSEVGQRAFGGWEKLDVPAIVRLQRSVDKTKRIPMLLAPALVPGFKPKLDRYLSLLTRVYAAVHEVSGAEVIIDSSKIPSLPYALRHDGSVNLTIAHVVRDPRGVAYSWSKRNQIEVRAELGDGEPAYMSTWTPRTVARRWVTVNSMIAVLPRLGVSVVRLRYEDMVHDPGPELVRVAHVLGEDVDAGDLAFIRPGEVEMRPAHTSSGNPNRFDAGWIPLRLDEAWRSSFPKGSRRTVERITAPLRGVYGYKK